MLLNPDQSSITRADQVVFAQARSSADVIANAIYGCVVEPRHEDNAILLSTYHAARQPRYQIKLSFPTKMAKVGFYAADWAWFAIVYKDGIFWRSQPDTESRENVFVLTPRSSWSVPGYNLWAEPAAIERVVADAQREIAQIKSAMLGGSPLRIPAKLRNLADAAAEKCARPQTGSIEAWAKRLADDSGDAVD